MKILVVGASQGTGAHCVNIALGKGHQVSAFARSPARLTTEHANLRRIAGDFHRAESVDEAVKGHDAVIITASSTSMRGFKDNPNYFSAGTAHVIAAMQRHAVRRLSVLSALGVGESRALSNWFLRTFAIGWLLKAPFEDHERQEHQVRQSGLDWVIVRPGRLTDGPSRRQYVKRAEVVPVPMSIARADVADFLVDVCEGDTWVGKAVQIGG